MQRKINHYQLKYEFVRLRFIGYDETGYLGYLNDVKNGRIIEFDIDKNLEILQYIENLKDYVSQPSRRDKFLRVYRIFENYNGKPELSWRSVRVSISHSATKVTEKPIVDYLLSNFGELDISFSRSTQVALFYRLFGELVEATYSLLLIQLKSVKILPINASQEISEILNAMRDRYLADSRRRAFRLGAMVHYGDLEERLRKYIPERLTNPYVILR